MENLELDSIIDLYYEQLNNIKNNYKIFSLDEYCANLYYLTEIKFVAMKKIKQIQKLQTESREYKNNVEQIDKIEFLMRRTREENDLVLTGLTGSQKSIYEKIKKSKEKDDSIKNFKDEFFYWNKKSSFSKAFFQENGDELYLIN